MGKTKYKNIEIGDVFGKLEVIGYFGKNNNNSNIWVCKCNCHSGIVKNILENSLKAGLTKSCGCI